MTNGTLQNLAKERILRLSPEQTSRLLKFMEEMDDTYDSTQNVEDSTLLGSRISCANPTESPVRNDAMRSPQPKNRHNEQNA